MKFTDEDMDWQHAHGIISAELTKAKTEIERLRAALNELADDPFMDPEGTRQFCLKALGQGVKVP